jgi:ParB family transcriptional regulator, chromosome partitioning protein
MPERERFSGEGGEPQGEQRRGGRFSTATADQPTGSSSRSRKRFTVESLFADTRPQAVGVSDLPNAKEIQLDRILADPDQPRRTFDEDKLRELADSIAAEGVLQPIVVRYDLDADTYVIVHGERRWRASRLAARATIPAIVREVPAERRLIHQLMENIVRDDLNAVDRAAALRALKGQLGDPPWEQVAEAVGIRRSRLFQLLGTEKLPQTAREDIRAGRISEKQSRALQGLSPARQEALRERIVVADLSVREATALARRLKQTPAREPEDTAAARATLARLITAADAAGPSPSSPTVPLLAAIRDAVRDGGSAGARARLRSLAHEATAQPFDEQRLHRDIASLAHMLARAAPTELASITVRQELAALHEALDALLNPRLPARS